MKIKGLSKRISLTLFSVVFSLSLNSAYADEGDLTVGLNLGQTIYASSEMDAFGSNAMGFGGYFGFSPSDILNIMMNLMYSPYSENSNEADLFYGTLDVQLKTNYDMMMPYFGAGLGFYRNSISTNLVDGASTAFGINFGGGLDVLIADKFTVGFAANYHTVFNQDISNVTSLADFFDIMLKVGYRFNTGTSSGW